MSKFAKYQHVERFGTSGVAGIEYGRCDIFPKIDGTNGQLYEDAGKVKVGSRNRVLSLIEDNQGFLAHMAEDKNKYIDFFIAYPDVTLYGEWLVPHSLKTYEDDAWRQFYVFDVVKYAGTDKEYYIPYDMYRPVMGYHGIKYIPRLAQIDNPTYDQLVETMERNDYLIKEGEGAGEGIVIKNYTYRNSRGVVKWAKIVSSEFKNTAGRKPDKVPSVKGSCEERIILDFCTEALIEKTYAKIVNDEGEWQDKFIPRLLHTVYYDLVTEEIWNIVKKYKSPLINFGKLKGDVITQIKMIKPELF